METDDEPRVKTYQGVMSRKEATLQAESELEQALVCLMELEDYAGASLYTQLAMETIEAIETDIADEAAKAQSLIESMAEKEAETGMPS